MIEGIGRMHQISPLPSEGGARTSDHRAGARAEPRGADAGMTVNFAGVGAEMAASPPVDAAKVASLRAAIANGDYHADPLAIALAMMAQGKP